MTSDQTRLVRELRALEDPENEAWLSPISVWETLILVERGRLALQPDADTWIRTCLAQSPVTEAPLTREVALESRRIQPAHEDPADRFLAATARVYDLTLVTADERLLGAGGELSLMANE